MRFGINHPNLRICDLCTGTPRICDGGMSPRICGFSTSSYSNKFKLLRLIIGYSIMNEKSAKMPTVGRVNVYPPSNVVCRRERSPNPRLGFITLFAAINSSFQLDIFYSQRDCCTQNFTESFLWGTFHLFSVKLFIIIVHTMYMYIQFVAISSIK